jgi:hypothetical protein
MYTIITGMNGTATYHGYPPATMGAWGQPIFAGHPQYYNIGGTHYNIQPSAHAFPQAFPYSAPSVPISIRPNGYGW